MNAKSGLCPEDCGYCSQSKISTADIPKYNLLSRDKLLEGARLAAEQTGPLPIASSSPPAAQASGEMESRRNDRPREIKQRYNVQDLAPVSAC